MPRFALLIALSLVACQPDSFSYGDEGSSGSSGAGGKPSDCDGEGCTSECPLGTQRNAAGECESTCGSWQTGLTTQVPSSISAAGDRVFVAGTSSPDDGRPKQAQLSPLFACSGATQDAVLPIDGDSSMAGGVGATSSSVYTTGTRESAGSVEAVVVELDPSTLAQKSTTTLTGLPADAKPTALATAASGVWVVGSSPGSTPWLAHVVPASGSCALTLPGQGEATSVAALDDGAVVAIDRAAKLGVVRVDAASCTPPACNCQVGMQADPTPIAGADVSAPRSVAVLGRTAFVAGNARTGLGDARGFVAAIDVDSGSVSAAIDWDIGPGNDGLFAVSAGADRLLVGGITGVADITDLSTGHAVIGAFALPLTDQGQGIWSAERSELNWIQSIALHPDLGVFAVGPGDSAGSVALHCNADGC